MEPCSNGEPRAENASPGCPQVLRTRLSYSVRVRVMVIARARVRVIQLGPLIVCRASL